MHTHTHKQPICPTQQYNHLSHACLPTPLIPTQWRRTGVPASCPSLIHPPDTFCTEHSCYWSHGRQQGASFRENTHIYIYVYISSLNTSNAQENMQRLLKGLLMSKDRQGLKIYQSLSRVTLFFLFAFLSTHKPEASCLFNNYNYFIAGNINTAVLLIWTCVFFEIHADFNDKETNRPAILYCLHFLNNSFFWQFWSAALKHTQTWT